jgi:hypothetical protein
MARLSDKLGGAVRVTPDPLSVADEEIRQLLDNSIAASRESASGRGGEPNALR